MIESIRAQKRLFEHVQKRATAPEISLRFNGQLSAQHGLSLCHVFRVLVLLNQCVLDTKVYTGSPHL